jgi:NTE family protein
MIDPQIRADGLYFLKRNPLFGSLGEEILHQMVERLKPLSVDKGSTLLREGEPGDGLYIVKSGRVRITAKSERGEEQTVAFIGRGDAAGELALLTSEPHAYSAISDMPCELLVLLKTDFDAVLEAHPLIGIQLSRALSKRLVLSTHLAQTKPKAPQLIALIPALPHEASVLFTVNLIIALVEQTRRKVLLLDMSPRSGELAQALGLHPPPAADLLRQPEDLEDLTILHQLITTHPSGLEILSLHPRILKADLLVGVPTLFSVLKDHYDFTVVLTPLEKDPLAQALLDEADRVLFAEWDAASEVASSTRAAMQENLGPKAPPMTTVYLHHPSTIGSRRADFRVPWTESLHQPFRGSGTPYLSTAEAEATIVSLGRIARALGKLRVGLAMGSGAALGYSLIGMLEVFEREGIPIDLVSGCSMGALLGSFYCAGHSPARIREFAKTITKHWLVRNIFGDLTFPHAGFLAGQTLSAFLRSILGTVEFHQLQIPFAAVATDIRTGDEVVLREGRVADAVRASTCLPIIFRPYLHQDHYLVDGGLVNPVPTTTVANMGADVLISVNLTAKPSIRHRPTRARLALPQAFHSPRMMEVFFKMIYTMQYEIAQARTEIAHVVIAPSPRDFLWTDFHRSEEIIPIGVEAAEEAIPKIKSHLPYFADYCRVHLGQTTRGL